MQDTAGQTIRTGNTVALSYLTAPASAWTGYRPVSLTYNVFDVMDVDVLNRVVVLEWDDHGYAKVEARPKVEYAEELWAFTWVDGESAGALVEGHLFVLGPDAPGAHYDPDRVPVPDRNS